METRKQAQKANGKQPQKKGSRNQPERKGQQAGLQKKSLPPRLLPWPSEDGNPCYLLPDANGGYLSRLADDMEAEQLETGVDVLEHARKLLDDPMSPYTEVRYAGIRLAECLSDALRVAESRGMRLPAPEPEPDIPETTEPARTPKAARSARTAKTGGTAESGRPIRTAKTAQTGSTGGTRPSSPGTA